MKIAAFILAILLAVPAFAQTTQPSITVGADVEDGKKMVHALVALNGKPCENVVLDYYVQRTFGSLKIGEDTTLDDGTSAVSFPSDLPGSADGALHVIVRVKGPEQFSSDSASATFPADIQPPPADDAFPRALWAPQAPLGLMASIFVLLAAVWGSYLFVVSRILAIRTGGKS
jgi:hypothetical protein